MANLLAFDTSTPNLVVGLSYNSNNYLHDPVQTIKHTDVILPAIDSVLNKANASKKNLDAIVVGIGPGSFMGVRTAIACAQGLAFALDIPVIPIHSLDILATTAYRKHGWQKIAVAWDARMSAVYFNSYIEQDAILQPQQLDQVLSPQTIMVEADMVLVGNGWSEYAAEFNLDLAQHNQDAGLIPTAEALLELGARNMDKQIAANQ